MFRHLAATLTRTYVLLAVGLIVLVAGTTTALAFFLYLSSSRDVVSVATLRAQQAFARSQASGQTLAQAAPDIVRQVGHGPVRVSIFDSNRRRLAGNTEASHTRRFWEGIGLLSALPRQLVSVPGGSIVVSADIDRFAQLLLLYWSIVLPVGALAVLIAWAIARRIAARAVAPLVAVTTALHAIAAGDMTPGQLLASDGELRELTDAYNQVAHRLAVATAERRQTETQMRQFIADAGHELRTPLTVIMGYIDAMRNGVVTDSSAMTRVLDTMLGESRRMRGLIEKLIYLARLDRTESTKNPVPAYVGEIVENAINALRPVSRDAVIRDGTGNCVVLAEPDELQEAVKNVLDNALKYGGGIVNVSVQCDTNDAVIKISDSGPGMDSTDAAHAFDRFYRGTNKGEVEGSGLGLAIAKRAAERIGGTLDLQSVPGEGTSVTFRLPLSAEPVL